MNHYLNLDNYIKGIGYQTIARPSYNQTFVWQTTYMNIANTNLPSVKSLRLRSDSNYQLVIL